MSSGKCQIAVFRASGQALELEWIKRPELQQGEYLIENEYVTLCRSDLNTFVGKRQEKTPTILGHEIVGRLREFGPDAPSKDGRGQELKIGDRVTWAIFASNPHTAMARRGIPQKSADLLKYGHEEITPASTLHGGLASHTILRRHSLLAKVDPAIPLPVITPLNCATATVAGALRLLGEIKNTRVLILGAGMLGLIAVAMAHAYGASEIVVVDIDANRLKLARRFGAKKVLGSSEAGDFPTGNAKFDHALDFTGIPAVMENGIRRLQIGGSMVFVGATYPARALQIEAEYIVRNLLSLRGLHNYNHADFIAAVNFIEMYHKDYPLASLIGKTFSLAEVNAAFAHAITENPPRVGILIGAEQ